MIVEGLVKSGSKEARSLAEDIAMKWIKTNYAAYKETGTMHEKYDVEKCGAFGGGGEYVPQVRIASYFTLLHSFYSVRIYYAVNLQSRWHQLEI